MFSAVVLPAAVLKAGTKIAFGLESDPMKAIQDEAASAAVGAVLDKIVSVAAPRFFTAESTALFAPLVLPRIPR